MTAAALEAIPDAEPEPETAAQEEPLNHWVGKEALEHSRLFDIQAVAACGKVWKPGSEIAGAQTCETCAERYGSLPRRGRKMIMNDALLDRGDKYKHAWQAVRGFLAEGEADGETVVEIARLIAMMDDLRREADKPVRRAQATINMMDDIAAEAFGHALDDDDQAHAEAVVAEAIADAAADVDPDAVPADDPEPSSARDLEEQEQQLMGVDQPDAPMAGAPSDEEVQRARDRSSDDA